MNTAAVEQSIRAFASQAEGLVFESQPRQTQGVEIGNDSSTAKRSATDVSVFGNDHYKRVSRVTIGVAR